MGTNKNYGPEAENAVHPSSEVLHSYRDHHIIIEFPHFCLPDFPSTSTIPYTPVAELLLTSSCVPQDSSTLSYRSHNEESSEPNSY
jgi:hypothetical protein